MDGGVSWPRGRFRLLSMLLAPEIEPVLGHHGRDLCWSCEVGAEKPFVASRICLGKVVMGFGHEQPLGPISEQRSLCQDEE